MGGVLQGSTEGTVKLRIVIHHKIHPYYWHLWAMSRRSDMARTGYYRQQPFYVPARIGNVMLEKTEPPPTNEDFQVADKISATLVGLRQTRPRQVLYLEIYEGAYQDASPERPKRYAQMKVKPSTCRREANKAKRWVATNI